MRFWRQFQGDERPFGLLELPLNLLPVGKHEVIIGIVGEAVLSALSGTHPSLADYQADPAGLDAPDLQGAMARIKLQAMAGDPLAQSAVGTMLCDRSRTRLDSTYLEEAEEWYRKAAASGDEAAVQQFDDWPREKQSIVDEIARRLKGEG